jgi:hypothetical protein
VIPLPHNFNPNVIAIENPDVVIFEAAEQFIDRLLETNPDPIRGILQAE